MSDWQSASWPAPSGIIALSTLRGGGVSTGPWASFNLGSHVGDDARAVAENRRRLSLALPPASHIQWLQQVHGTQVLQAPCADPDSVLADACWTATARVACAVLTADCLPVLLCDTTGTVVAAAHAGWRGLCEGVLENTVAALPVAAGQLMAWLGPAISAAAFEVGPEVRAAFLAYSPHRATESCFVRSRRPGHYFADLYALARLRLADAGVSRVYGGDACTYGEAERYFSYRRDGVSGRMASLILRL